MKDQELEMLAQQLRCPSGKYAKEVGETMFHSNSNMIYKAIQVLKLERGEYILEIGFGNGQHLKQLFKQIDDLKYLGIDISESMVALASEYNADLIEKGKTVFKLIEPGSEFFLADNEFDACFTVNTLYFWEDPSKMFQQIYRVLKSEGKLAIAFIEKEFGEQLPFTQHGFTFYQKEEVKRLMANAGFGSITFTETIEQAISKNGKEVTRPFVVMVGKK